MKSVIAKKWVLQALHDLQMAERNLAIDGYDIAAFLSHQAIEKLLKALFIMAEKPIPKIHYIDELARRLNLSKDIVSCVIELSGDYVLSRYPDVSEKVPFQMYTYKLTKEKVDAAKKVFSLLKERYQELLESENDD